MVFGILPLFLRLLQACARKGLMNEKKSFMATIAPKK